MSARLRWWSAPAGLDLLHLGTVADADEIKDTTRTQPLLVAAALLAAADEAAARERLLSTFGSQHGVARRYIEIRGIAEVPAAELQDAVVRYTLEEKA